MFINIVFINLFHNIGFFLKVYLFFFHIQIKKDRIEDLKLHAQKMGHKFKFYKEDLLNKDKNNG